MTTTMNEYLDHLAQASMDRAAELSADTELREMATLIAQMLTDDEWLALNFEALDIDARSYLERAADARSRGLSGDFLRRFADEDRGALIGFLIVSHELENREA